jgi:hypothetical protein
MVHMSDRRVEFLAQPARNAMSIAHKTQTESETRGCKLFSSRLLCCYEHLRYPCRLHIPCNGSFLPPKISPVGQSVRQLYHTV